MKEERFLTPKDFDEDIPDSMKDLFHEAEAPSASLEDFDLSELDALLGPEFSEFSSEEAIPDTFPSEQGASSEDFSIGDFSMDPLCAESDVPSSEESTVLPTPASSPSRKAKPAKVKTKAAKKETDASKPKFTAFITKNRKTTLLISCGAVIGVLLLCILGFLIGRAMDPFENRILPNTTLGGIDVGGMTRMEAYQAVKSATENTFSQQNMEVTLPDGTITLSPENTKVKLNIWSAVNAAFSHGRKGTEEQKQTALQVSQGAGCNVDMLPFLKLDQDFIRTQLEAYAAQHNVPHTELSYHLEGQQPALGEDQYSESAPVQTLELTLGTPLEELPVDAVLTSILDAYRFNQFQVTIDSIEYQTTPEAPDVQALYEEFYIAPVNTSLDLQTYEQLPGSYGYALDTQAAKKLIADAQYGETVSIPMTYVRPEILGDEAYFRDELGYCETPHTNNDNRNTNLKLACAALDGLILQPGEEFSYNNTLGERTKEKGYKPAAAYSGTNTVDSIGGGVCQGSSTLYYATLLADLEVVERVNHGFRSTYIDIGLDATVNWGGPDYRFKNSSHFPIMIKAEVSDGFVKMWIYGTDEKDYYVKLESEVTGYTEAGKTYREVSSKSKYRDGQLISGGTDGWYARSYSCKYDKETDELISRDPITYSSYMMVNAVYAKVVD